MTRVGLMLPPHGDPCAYPSLAQQAEQHGFNFVACGEHVFFHGPVPNAFVSLAAVAGATSRVRLLSALTILPVYPAALAAKMIATLDRVSRGRFDLGIGVGGEYPPEFEACGVPVRDRGSRTDTSLQLLKRLMAGGTLGEGAGTSNIAGLTLDPLPMQSPGPPIWIGGRSAAAMRRAGKFGDYWFPYLVTPEQFADGMTRVREESRIADRPNADVRGAVFLWAAVDRDRTRARRVAIETVSRIYRKDMQPVAERYLPAATPQEVARIIGDYVQAGADAVVFSPACPPEHQTAMVSLFAEEVLPALEPDDACSSYDSPEVAS